MSYSTQADLSEDPQLLRRIAACAATQQVAEYPTTWAARHMWHLAASPGWDQAYETALLNSVEDPGGDPGVISDSMILSAVQKLLTPEEPSEEEE